MAKTQRSNLKNKRCWRGAQMSRVITPSTETTTSQSHNIQTQCRWYEQSWERRKERERMNRGQKRSRLWTTEAWGGNPQITKIIKKKKTHGKCYEMSTWKMWCNIIMILFCSFNELLMYNEYTLLPLLKKVTGTSPFAATAPWEPSLPASFLQRPVS